MFVTSNNELLYIMHHTGHRIRYYVTCLSLLYINKDWTHTVCVLSEHQLWPSMFTLMLYFCSSVAITCLKFCVWRRYAAGILSHTYGLFTFSFLFQQTKLHHNKLHENVHLGHWADVSGLRATKANTRWFRSGPDHVHTIKEPLRSSFGNGPRPPPPKALGAHLFLCLSVSVCVLEYLYIFLKRKAKMVAQKQKSFLSEVKWGFHWPASIPAARGYSTAGVPLCDLNHAFYFESWRNRFDSYGSVVACIELKHFFFLKETNGKSKIVGLALLPTKNDE